MKISPTGAACGSAEIKKPTQDIKSQEIDIGGENAKTKRPYGTEKSETAIAI